MMAAEYTSESDKKARRFLWRYVSIIYCLFIICLGFSIVLYFSLTRKDVDKTPFFEILFVLLYLSSTVIIAVLLFLTRKWRNETFYSDDLAQKTEDLANGARLSGSDENVKLNDQVPFVSHNGEGFNMYLRLGLGIFFFGSILYNIIRIIGEVTFLPKCFNGATVVLAISQSLFFSFQTIYLFTYHKVIYLKYKPYIRFLLMHIFVTNICSWAHSAIGEISEGIAANKEIAKRMANLTEGIIMANVSTVKPVEMEVSCLEEPITAMFRPFLIPAIIEYCLLGGPMILEILIRVGRLEEALEHESSEGENDEAKFPVLHKSHRGLIIGSVVFTLSIVCIVLFYVFGSSPIGSVIFHLIDISLNFVAFVMTIYLAKSLRNLTFAKAEKDSFDDKLLLLSVIGTFIYCIVSIASSIDHMASADVTLLSLEIVTNLMKLGQVSLQTLVLLDGLRRRASVVDHWMMKPGRPFLTTLLGINGAMWLFCTFEVKKNDILYSATIAEVSGFKIGADAWTILLHTTLPMVVFYRYHSTALLSIIWDKAYKKED